MNELHLLGKGAAEFLDAFAGTVNGALDALIEGLVLNKLRQEAASEGVARTVRVDHFDGGHGVLDHGGVVRACHEHGLGALRDDHCSGRAGLGLIGHQLRDLLDVRGLKLTQY